MQYWTYDTPSGPSGWLFETQQEAEDEMIIDAMAFREGDHSKSLAVAVGLGYSIREVEVQRWRTTP